MIYLWIIGRIWPQRSHAWKLIVLLRWAAYRAAYPSECTLPLRGFSVKVVDTTDTARKDIFYHTTRYDGVLSMSHINWVVVELSASWYLQRIPWQSILLQEHARFPRSRGCHPSNSLDAALICHLKFSPQRIRKPWETGMMWSIIELSVFTCQNWWHMGTFFKRYSRPGDRQWAMPGVYRHGPSNEHPIVNSNV